MYNSKVCPPFSESQNESYQRFGSDHVTKSTPLRDPSKGGLSKSLKKLAGGRGLEPRFTESESVVLPLNDPPIINRIAQRAKRIGFSIYL